MASLLYFGSYDWLINVMVYIHQSFIFAQILDKKEVMLVVHWLQESAEFAWYADLLDEKDITCHFSLKLPVYVQFTSPIRRYMDIIIHRFVIAALDDQSTPYTVEEVGVMYFYVCICIFASIIQVMRRVYSQLFLVAIFLCMSQFSEFLVPFSLFGFTVLITGYFVC